MSDLFYIVALIVIAFCYFVYKVCEIILTIIKAKYKYQEESEADQKISMKVGDTTNDIEDNGGHTSEIEKEC